MLFHNGIPLLVLYPEPCCSPAVESMQMPSLLPFHSNVVSHTKTNRTPSSTKQLRDNEDADRETSRRRRTPQQPLASRSLYRRLAPAPRAPGCPPHVCTRRWSRWWGCGLFSFPPHGFWRGDRSIGIGVGNNTSTQTHGGKSGGWRQSWWRRRRRCGPAVYGTRDIRKNIFRHAGIRYLAGQKYVLLLRAKRVGDSLVECFGLPGGRRDRAGGSVEKWQGCLAAREANEGYAVG